jgi:hypothetical protein
MTDFRLLLERGDPKALRAAWKTVAPHLPQPASDEQAEIAMHHARTQAESIPMALRQYSHDWLVERNLPSALPPKDQPRIAETVGISVNFRSSFLKPAATEVRTAMEHAVLDRYAMGDKDPAIVQAAMAEAREKTMRALFGRR